MYQNNNNNNYRNELVYENTVDGRIIPVRDGEAMVFEITINPFKIVCIANIPEEGKTTAPVYLKFKMNDGRSNGGFRKRYPRDETRNFNRDVPVEYKNGEPPSSDPDVGDDGQEDDGGRFTYNRT